MTASVASADGLPRTQPEPIRYRLRFPAPGTHYVEVEAVFPSPGLEHIDLALAVWTPGSYLVREYSRHVEQVRAESAGQPREVRKTAKNRWRVQTGGAAEVAVSYRVYGREMTVRTNFIEAGFALLNGAPTFITLAGDTGPRAHEVRLVLPAGWSSSHTGLPPAPGGAAHHYVAADYDTLVDSPIVAGSPAVYDFSVQGRPHALVNVGDDGFWDGPASAADLQKIVEAHAAFWGGLPYDRYVFINMITEASGGLEHANSTVLMTSRWRTRVRRSYVDWLSLASHEFFHVWNVKRLRPVELGPFDYGAENYTRTLWVAEGLTSYYGDLLAVRAGVITADEYLAELSTMIASVQLTPGRLAQSVEEASFDAWIRHYRPDENTPNSTISYYDKGGVIGFLLDLAIRKASGDGRSLDDVMRAAMARFAGARGFSSDQFRRLVSEIAGADLSAWLDRALDTTAELDYGDIAWLGLRFKPDTPPSGAWAGLTLGSPRPTLRDDAGRLVVARVLRGSPAFDAGVNADDEIVAIAGYRVRPDQWERRLDALRPGELVPLLVARRDRLVTLQLTLAAPPSASWRLERSPEATPDASGRLERWLTQPR